MSQHTEPHIWLAYVPYPITTAVYLERALRKFCSVTTIGPPFPEELIDTWQLQNLKQPFSKPDLVTPFAPDLTEYTVPHNSGRKPDLFLWVESVGGYFPQNIKALGCPTACWLIDTHLSLSWHLKWAEQFDFVFVAQLEYVERFRAAGLHAHWLPLGCDPEIHAQAGVPKKHALSFVGSLSHNPRRQQLLKQLDEEIGIYCERCWWDEMARVISESAITFNNAVKNDLNMRVFEALSIGTLLLTDQAPNSGLTTLFHDGEDLALYHSDEELPEVARFYLNNPLLQEQIAARGRQLVHNAHTYRHRADDLIAVTLQGKTSTRTADELREQSLAGVAAPFSTCLHQQAQRTPETRSFVIPVLDYSPASPYNITTLLADLEKIPGEVIVIFNNPAVAEELKSHPRITRSATMSENIGVARAWNVGISMATTAYVMILNADLQLERPVIDAIEQGLASLDQAACVGPQGSFVNYRLCKDFLYFDKGCFDRPVEVDAVSGFLFGIRRDLFGPGGLKFEEAFTPCYFEEWDLGLQIKQTGMKSWIVPAASYDHHWGGSIGGRREIDCLGRSETAQTILQHNRLFFLHKWRNPASGLLPESRWRTYGCSYTEQLLADNNLQQAALAAQTLTTEWPDDPAIMTVCMKIAFEQGDMRKSAALSRKLHHASAANTTASEFQAGFSAPRISAAHDLEIAAQYAIPTDDTRYFDQQLGIVAVDTQRWQAAQEVERKTWFSLFPELQDDRSAEHRQLFDDYRALPTACGDVLEIGCGPFTQARSILNNRSVHSLTLLDPLLAEYLGHPHCSYRDGLFYGYPASLLSIPAERLPDSLRFDLAICINVLEHVQDARLVLKKLITAVRPGGYLILGEYCHDAYNPSESFHLAHPIMLKRSFLQQMTAGLELLYRNERDDLYYLIARMPLQTP